MDPEVVIDSLDPADDNPDKSWDIDCAVNDLPSKGSECPPKWHPELLSRGQDYYMTAELNKSDSKHVRRHFATISVAPVLGTMIVRIAALALLAAGVLTCGGWMIRRNAIRNKRLRTNFNPYVVGGAITEQDGFFGRAQLLNLIRDTIANTSYALTGEFRIGKTSLQHQLTHLLTSLDEPKYKFLPVFMDLQILGEDGEPRFFYFMGAHLLELAKRHHVPPSVLDGLAFTEVDESDPEDYDIQDFRDDLATLLDYWDEAFAEKQPVVVLQIDEIALVKVFSNDTLLRFRSIFVHEPRVKTILSGIQIPRHQDSFALSQWWNFFVEIEVEPMTFDEAKELITEPVHGIFTFDRDIVQRIHARSLGRPMGLQKLCSDILVNKYEKRRFKRRISAEDFEDTIKSEREKVS